MPLTSFSKPTILLIGMLVLFNAGDAGPVRAQEAGTPGELSWELPGRLSIYDLEMGPAVLKDNQWRFLGNIRKLSVETYGNRLTMMVRFSYTASRPEIPLKFVVKLPDSRQYEEEAVLPNRRGNYVYRFTIHDPEDFVGDGSVSLYLYYNIVDVLDFTLKRG